MTRAAKFASLHVLAPRPPKAPPQASSPGAVTATLGPMPTVSAELTTFGPEGPPPPPQRTVRTVGKRTIKPASVFASSGGSSVATPGAFVAPESSPSESVSPMFLPTGSGGGGGGSAPEGERASFTVASGEIPDGAVYLAVAAAVAAGGFLLWRKYRR